jgi:hypothetical protein
MAGNGILMPLLEKSILENMMRTNGGISQYSCQQHMLVFAPAK